MIMLMMAFLIALALVLIAGVLAIIIRPGHYWKGLLVIACVV